MIINDNKLIVLKLLQLQVCIENTLLNTINMSVANNFIIDIWLSYMYM